MDELFAAISSLDFALSSDSWSATCDRIRKAIATLESCNQNATAVLAPDFTD